jgi:replicative DNA helicase
MFEDKTTSNKSFQKREKHDQRVDAIKTPPHSIEAEQSVLGGLMLDSQAWDKIADQLSEQDFYRHEHSLIFKAMQTLIDKQQPLDVLTVAETLKHHNQLEKAGGEIFLFELAKNTPSAANIVAYASIVRERSIMRQLINAAGKIADSAFGANGKDSEQILDTAERLVFSIAEQTQRGSGPTAIKELLAEALERIDLLYHSTEAITGLSTGYMDLDNMTSGLQQEDLIIIAGRPSMGKTTFAMNIAENIAIKINKPVLIFSMEMPASSIAMRLLSSLGRIDQHKIRSGKLSDEDWPRLTSVMGMLSEVPLLIDDTPALSPQELRARARRVAREHNGLGLIVIDYLQLMKIPGYGSENRTGEISEISRSLKSLARELKVPVIALSQLNRSLEQRSDRRPIMSDLRESGAIEQDADLIVFIYRDEVYNEQTNDKGIAEIIIAKQRNGPIGKVRLTFLGQYTRFENFTDDRFFNRTQ